MLEVGVEVRVGVKVEEEEEVRVGVKVQEEVEVEGLRRASGGKGFAL